MRTTVRPKPLPPNPPSRAFTLVELLVVIGIIALLLALLVPVLGSVRERASRTSCLSNLRQTYLAYALYAEANRDMVPIGYRLNPAWGAQGKQLNSQIYVGFGQRYVLMGLLYQAGLMREGRVFFCPSEENPRFAYATEQNPWPPGEGVNVTRNTSAGYAMRPDVAIPDVLANAAPDFEMPRLRDFAGRAILADLTSSKVRLDTRHAKGLNAAYGDGSARWVDRKAITPWIDQLPEPTIPPDPQWNDEQDEIWRGLDRAG